MGSGATGWGNKSTPARGNDDEKRILPAIVFSSCDILDPGEKERKKESVCKAFVSSRVKQES